VKNKETSSIPRFVFLSNEEKPIKKGHFEKPGIAGFLACAKAGKMPANPDAG